MIVISLAQVEAALAGEKVLVKGYTPKPKQPRKKGGRKPKK